LTNLSAAEAAGGNLSIFTKFLANIPVQFSIQQPISLPVVTPELAEGWLIITRSGSRLRDISHSVENSLCLVKIHPGGQTGILWTAVPGRPSSEWNTHLAVHNSQVSEHNLELHAISHAQPIHLTYLSHCFEYSEFLTLNQKILRWQPETILTFPEGIGVLPFLIPGSEQLMRASVSALQTHQAVIWQRHGIMTRSDQGLIKTADLVEYAETAARYECINLQCGNLSEGLSLEELKQICILHGVFSPFAE
jgi:rhamnulose-1-phosphate aldolase